MTPVPSTPFSASYDKMTKIMTVTVCLILTAAVLVTRNPVAGLFLVLTFALGYAYSPRGYTLEGRALIVRRLIGKVSVPLEDLRVARPTKTDDFRGCLRLWGSGGFFGYYGLFRTTNLGKCTWYVTNRSNAIVVVTGAKTVLLSPDDKDGFLAAVRPAGFIAPPDNAAEAKQPDTWMRVAVAAMVLAALGLLLAFVFLFRRALPR